MSVVEEEVVDLLKNKFFVVGLDNQLCKWSSSKFIEVYHLLLSVLNSSYDQQCDSEENSLKHICRCMRLLGLGHLITKPRSLVDFRKAPRLITALEDKITARYGSGTAQRIRSVIKSLEKKKKSHKVKSGKQVKLKELEHQENEEPSTTLSKPTMTGPSEAGTILTGRQIPRTPMRVLNAHNVNSNSRQTLTLSPVKNTGQQGIVTKKVPQNLKNYNSLECEDIFEKVTDVKEGNEQLSIVPMGSSGSGKTPLSKQLSHTPDLNTSKNVHPHEHRVTSTETPKKTEPQTSAPLCRQLNCTPDLNTTKTVLPNQHKVTSTETTLKTELDQISAPSMSSCSSRVDIPNCNNISNVVICDQTYLDKSSINEKYQGPPPPIISPPEEFRSDSLPQCILNGEKERNYKEKLSVLQSSPSDGVPLNMGTFDLSAIENLQDKIALHEGATVPFPNSSFQNMSGSYTLPSALLSSLGNKIPLGRQLSRTPPFIVLEQKSDIKASGSSSPTKPKSCNTSDIASVSSDISCVVTSKAGLGNTFIVSSEKEESASSGDFHDGRSVTEGLAVQKAANDDNLKGQDEGGTDNILQELLETTKNLHDNDNSLPIFCRRKQRKQVKAKEFSEWLESSITVNKEHADENSEEQIFEDNTTRRSSIFPEENRLSILEEVPVLSASYSYHCGRESFSQSPKRLSILENSIPTGRQLCRTPPLHMVGKDSGTLVGNENVVEAHNSTSEGNNSLSSGLSEKAIGLEMGVEHETKPTTLGNSENIAEAPNIAKESCNSLTSVVSEKATALQTSVELETESDTLTDSKNIAEPPNVTESYNSLSSVVSEKATELETVTDVLETDVSRIKLELPSAFTQEDIYQIMLRIDEDESFEIFPKEKKTREMKEKTDNVTGTAVDVVLKDTGDVLKENFKDVVTKAETTTPVKQQDISGENLEHVGCALKTIATEKHRDESYEILPERKTTKVENRNTLRKIAVKNMTYNKRKGNKGKDCMEYDVITDCKSLQPSENALRQNDKTLVKSSVVIEDVHKGKQVSDMDDSLAQVCTETVKKSEPTRKTLKQNTKIQEEEFHHVLPKDLEGEACVMDTDESLHFFSERIPTQSVIRNSNKDNKKTTAVENNPGRDKKPNPQKKETSRQKMDLQDKNLHHMSTKDIEAYSDADVRKSEQTRTLRKSTRSQKEEFHMLYKDIHDKNEQVCRLENELPENFQDRNVYPGNGNSPSREAIEKTAASDKGLVNQGCVEDGLVTDKHPRNKKSRTSRKATKIQEEKSHFTKGVQEDIQDSMSNDSLMKVLSETTAKKTKRQTKKTRQQDVEGKGKEAHHMLSTNIQESCDDSTSLMGLKHHDENILGEGILHTLNTLKKQRGRRKNIKKDAAIDSTGENISSKQTPNKVQKITLRRTRNKDSGSIAPVISENCQKFDSGRNVDEKSSVAKGKNCKDKECDIVNGVSSEGDTGDILFGKRENQHSETTATKNKTPEANKVGICRQIRKRQAKTDTAEPEIITKTRGAKKRFVEKTDSNAKGEGEYAHSQEDLQSPTADGKRKGRNAKKRKEIVFNSPPSKAVNSSTDRSNPSENEAEKEISRDRARVTRKGRVGVKHTSEMKLTVSCRESPVKVVEPVEISGRKTRRTTNGSKFKDAVETRETKRPSNVKEVEPSERKTRRTTNGCRFKDDVETSETKKPSNVKETRSKKSRKKT